MSRIIIGSWPFFEVEIPDGYEIVEKEDHRKQRVGREIAYKKSLLKMAEERILTITKEIEELEKQL